MTYSVYVEDIFVEFFDLCQGSNNFLQAQEHSACLSFYDHLQKGQQLTQNQANFLLKILSKYKLISKRLGIDYQDAIENPVWKNTFRTIDLSKKVFVEKSDTTINICLKFPFSLKKEFDAEISGEQVNKYSRWDHDRRLRILNAYDFNLIHLHDFCQKHGFEMDNSFLDMVSEVEEVWQHQEKVSPHSVVENDIVMLKNAPESAQQYWEENRKNSVNQDLFLAKSMGYSATIDRTEKTHLEKICSSKEKYFWFNSLHDFFRVYKEVGGIAAILLDRNTKDTLGWLKNFVEFSDQHVPREDIKVCFREESEKNSVLNFWIKEQGLGGKVDTGKILIFQHKPPKWLFAKNVDVKIILTNSYTPHVEPLASTWILSHPCVCYVGDVKPTPPRNLKIAKL